jgi:hypothetical protein
MLSVLLGVAALGAGRTLSERLWSRERGHNGMTLEPLERVAAAATLGVAVVTAVSNALALAHALSRWTLLATTAAFLALGVPPIVRWLLAQGGRQVRLGPDAVIAGVALLPVGVYLLYVLWRTEQLFVLNHDGLAYHLPRAAMIARSGSLFAVDGPDSRVITWPANYELLLADILALDGSDELTGWLSPASFVAFLIAVGAMAQRWWGRGLHVIAVVCAAAAMPVAVVHAGTHKNDMMTNALILVTMHFAARWVVEEGITNFVLLCVGLTLAVCTKLTACFFAAALAPVVVWKFASMLRARKRPGADVWRVVTPVVVGSVLTLGPMVYVHNLVTTGRLFGFGSPDAESGWGDYANLWRFPYLALTVPFSRMNGFVWVPWDHKYWFWPNNDLFFSSYGVLTSIFVGALPIGLFLFARAAPLERRHERVIVSAVLTLTFLLVLPVLLRPLGFFAGFVRYTVFFPPVIALWTLAPSLRALVQIGGTAKVAALAAPLALATYFSYQAISLSISDPYAPFQALAEVVRHPELHRRIWFLPNRAASVADGLAGPDDSIAFEGSHDSWSYPLYGADLRRHVTYLHSERADFRVPEDARWVVIDRAWRIWFGHPKFKTLADWRKYLGRGRPSEDDLKVLRLLEADPRYELVYHLPQLNQAVFRRVDRPTEPPATQGGTE